MTEATKNEIQTLLKKHIEQYPSQKKAVDALRNVSEATVINVIKGKWESISEDMWRLIGKQVGMGKKDVWMFVPTKDSKKIVSLFNDSREFGNVYSIVAPAGGQKTETSKWYEGKNNNVYHIECSEYFNKKIFLQKILERMGKENLGYSMIEMIDVIIENMMKQEDPLIILDEVDKLNDSVLYFFISFYNAMKGKCGMVLLATDYFAKRIQRGVKLNKKGYKEIYSRIGRRFISLSGTTKEEVEEICAKNGLRDTDKVINIYNEYEGDLRRVERMVHRFKMKEKNITQKAA